ncbi:N-6 DNA methylase [Thermosyntropha sp.]|uniref:N-6 DNA methylase n=1 Tax=Thermosyntropha sp. TaxID=2740820 RepID=UPI0025D6B131|nr:N-6 DNA methylase [Thermosyntropha sp.]MBO8157963.1 N-6 DNA methylase [Thermosyntropha sp.]
MSRNNIDEQIVSIIKNISRRYSISKIEAVLFMLEALNSMETEGRVGISDDILRKIKKLELSTFEIYNFIKHNFNKLLSDLDRIVYGKYYTPKFLVELVYSYIRPYIKENAVIFDPACGCGAFLNYNDNFGSVRIVGNDIDKNAVRLLQMLKMDNVEIYNENFLLQVNRAKYNLSGNDFVIVIGNPPYNDITSKNKKTEKKSADIGLGIDDDIKTRDYGLSFLRAFNKLKADVVCILHPLSYLIKKTNFNLLKEFKDNYQLKKAIIFSSSEFAKTRKTPFPIVAALYVRGGGMDYEYIKNFKFDILYSDKSFCLKDVPTIDGYINKYPPRKKDGIKVSDISLYMYNFRDLNSLLTTANFTEKEDFNNHITINYKDLYKYAYLNCMKRYFGKDFLLGNLSPVVIIEDLESEYFKDLFIIDTIMNNQYISIFNIDNPNSILWTRGLFEEYKTKSAGFIEEHGRINIYRIFTDFVEGKGGKEMIRKITSEYFYNIKELFSCPLSENQIGLPPIGNIDKIAL